MQSNEPSKKTRKPAAPATADQQEGSKKVKAPEVKAKPRTSKSSTSKKTDTSESKPVKHHRRATSALTESPALSAPVTRVSAPPKTRAAAAGTTSGKPAHGEIAQLAYSYWVARGHDHGSSEEDWVRAERDLAKKS